MNERLSDELVANLAVWAADAKPTTREVEALAREVQEWRSTYIESGDDLRDFLRATDVTQAIDALCARHNITVEGIVALVDEVFDDAAWKRLHGTRDDLRRLARREEA